MKGRSRQISNLLKMDLARATLVLIRVLRTLINSIAKNLHKLPICLRFYSFYKKLDIQAIIKKNCLRRYFHARDILRRAGTVLTAPPAKGFCEAKDRAQAGRGSAVFWRNLAEKENLPLKKILAP